MPNLLFKIDGQGRADLPAYTFGVSYMPWVFGL